MEPAKTESRMKAELAPMWNKLSDVVQDIVNHSGFGEVRVTVRWLSKGRKEIIIASGKEYRFVVPVQTHTGDSEDGADSR